MPSRFVPLIACYHGVSNSWPHVLAVSPSLLQRQLETLIGLGYRPARLRDVLDVRHRRLLHVTFDDAFASVLHALPILERLGVPATVFVCTGFADDGRPLDIPELADQVDAYDGQLDTLDWTELAALPDFVEVGSHTVSHAHLTQLDDGRLFHELSASRQRIEECLGNPCRYLAYPFGEEDARVRAAAREAGYLAAFALPGPARPADNYRIPRVGLFAHDGRFRTTLKASRAGRQMMPALRAIRGLAT